jgi:hypothetical protein
MNKEVYNCKIGYIDNVDPNAARAIRVSQLQSLLARVCRARFCEALAGTTPFTRR